LKQEDPNQ